FGGKCHWAIARANWDGPKPLYDLCLARLEATVGRTGCSSGGPGEVASPFSGQAAPSTQAGSWGHLLDLWHRLIFGRLSPSLLQDCPAGSAPFREIQCSLYNEKPILGGQMLYEWTPFHGAPNLCDLNCLAVGHNFYYSFGRVLDGTRCSPESRDLCISGRCLRAGCDGILGSNAQADACGICGGRNESCVFVRQVFRVAFPTSGD
uniref:ADAMTS/ADAMTS-like cysteine-rich domain-containing protein n=1 Tax=Varanus komodoensis TaxID=61221 RepID=A0A8D2LKD8_VARKO